MNCAISRVAQTNAGMFRLDAIKRVQALNFTHLTIIVFDCKEKNKRTQYKIVIESLSQH